ncbi:MAG: hypothetical protein HYW24_04570 [Candidatus Aenigmarchaeota archaeon]|nr:hypothetical protein [Candidatus Aenigmarchaeota archaeon]
MHLLKVLPVVLIVFLSGCTARNETNKSEPQPQQEIPELPQEEPTQTTQQPEGTLQGEVLSPPQEPQQLTRAFSIEADDRGFYMNSSKISSISSSKDDTIKITFIVRESGTYYGGLDFRGCGQNTASIKPGDSVVIQFTANSTCTITSYWPVTNVVKDNLQITVS